MDVEVVARELGLPDAMHARLRRTLDRLNCVQEILDAMAAHNMPGTEGRDVAAETTLRLGCPDSNDARRGHDAKMMHVRLALEMLAANWPQDYADDAVEWFVFDEQGQPEVYAKE
ncbi:MULTISPECIES: hypothetical protein [unclassified Caballeronia]|uniref:hypothetical protein n=1 Tax=unclassified Caballeronia TaxID=2646786 RepID=UPI0028545A78|nr:MULTISPECIES: hypothetical protein [unclassified Caballeronia]MDR5750209.1 hypothetical protein [Caballeronia sp. LZ024]MDR5842662.1 hypothetical protein [Caballeronia sp. LZ031]